VLRRTGKPGKRVNTRRTGIDDERQLDSDMMLQKQISGDIASNVCSDLKNNRTVEFSEFFYVGDDLLINLWNMKFLNLVFPH